VIEHSTYSRELTMFAVYAREANFNDPLAALALGERPEPMIPEGWVRVKISHASLNRHDIFTLRGITAQKKPIPYPMVLGTDGTGTLDDGTEVVIYPVLGSAEHRGDETLDPRWHVLSELVPGTMADYVAVPRQNAIPKPNGITSLHAALLGTAWLTAYRSLFTKAGVRPGQTVLVQGASGGMSTALIQMGRAAGVDVWVTTRSDHGATLAEKLGASRIFRSGERLPRPVDAVVDNIGAGSWSHSLHSVKRGGTVVINGVTTGHVAETDLLHIFVEQLDVQGSIMGTRAELIDMMDFVIRTGMTPEVGTVVPMTEAQREFAAMIEGRTQGKTVFTR
jgi:NADPH:quinone reductase-like Zn-dependent oxidoreductase